MRQEQQLGFVFLLLRLVKQRPS